MNGLDVAILAVFFGSTFIGLVRGFTKELLSLFSWGGAISLSYIFLPVGRSLVSPYIANPMMADGAALFCIFIISLIMLSVIASMIAGYIHESSFRGVDRSLGFGFGMLRGVVVISAAELIFSTFTPRHIQSPTFQTARFIPMARKGGNTILQLLPSSLRMMILEQAVKVENQLKMNAQQGANQMPQNMRPDGTMLMGNLATGMDSTINKSQTILPNGNAQQPGQQNMQQMPQGYGYPPVNQQPANGTVQQGVQGGVQGMMQPQAGMMPPTQSSQPAQYGAAPNQQPMMMPSPNSPMSGGNANVTAPSAPQGLVQSVLPHDTQSTVDQLSRLTPQSAPKEDSGYTQGQIDDMNRLFQAADGDE
jgi:uncharacterized membrane protein required for colicin V production